MTESDSMSADDWPLVRLDVSHLAADESARTLTTALLRAADRTGTFAAVVRMPERTERPKVISGVGERVRMLKQLRPRLKESCRGLVFVLSAEAQAANAKQLKAGAKLWGCPTYATDDVDAAVAWAQAQLGNGSANGAAENDI